MAICVLEVSVMFVCPPEVHIFWAIVLEDSKLCLLTRTSKYEDRELSNHLSI